MENRPRLLRITTVPISLKILLTGQLSFFKSHGFDVLAVSADGPEVKDIVAEGIPHHAVPMTRKITPFHDLVSLFALIRLISKFRPHIVHTHTPKAGLLGMMAAWFCRVPVRLHTVAGLPLMEETGVIRGLLMLTERITYKCATTVYPNSKGLAEFIARTFPGVPLKIIGNGSSNGIDTIYFKRTEMLENEAQRIREKYGISPDDIVFSFVGRVVKDKGITELTNAFKDLQMPASKKCFLLIVGPFEDDLDPLPNDVRNFLTQEPRVVVAGFQSDVRPWLMASDVFVFPSYREGFPNVVMQAACLEIPSIVSDINGCNEIIDHGKTGVVVPAKDTKALYEAMTTLASDPQARERYAQTSREFVVTNFDRQFLWGQLLKEYERVLNKENALPLEPRA
jgi:glycosyltransferase involved in cell wall biosynthesis